MARGSRVFHKRQRKDQALRAICNIIEETSNVEKLHATREKILHVQKSQTAEVAICIILEGLLDRPDSYRTLLLQIPTKGIEPIFFNDNEKF